MIGPGTIAGKQLVLVVDDLESNRLALGTILGAEYDIVYASNGREALGIMRERADELSIVLLDLIMPVMTGFVVLEQVRADEHLRRIPVIALTAERDTELLALQLGAADFITKPFNKKEVIRTRVGRIIELSEGRKLISAAELDVLTGLYTRGFFLEYASRIVHADPTTRMDAVVINIERFHSVNELYGYEFGDELLHLIGTCLTDYLTHVDGIASRFEADWFTLFCAEQEDYRDVLDRLQAAVNRVSHNVSVRLRMGVQHWQDNMEPVLMVDRARTACNMVRGNYQMPLMVYDKAMHDLELYNQRLLNDLRTALDEGQFVVYYQPKYSIQDDVPRLQSAEALVRWRHPELGLIPPSDFIPLFEGNGLINLVDGYVWRAAAHQVASWRDRMGVVLPVSVNLSRSDIFDSGLEQHLEAILSEDGLDHRSLKLEVTETAYADNAQRLLEVIRRLRERGFEIEMDDFGSGYSSLNLLSDMPVDVLKMDIKFVRNIEKSETDLRLVKLILDIARSLGVTVVAEGVETEGQLRLLREGGCDLVQGYYFSRPLPPEEFEVLLRRDLS